MFTRRYVYIVTTCIQVNYANAYRAYQNVTNQPNVNAGTMTVLMTKRYL